MNPRGRTTLRDPLSRALPYACVATIMLLAVGTALAGRVALVPFALMALAGAVLYAWRWGRVREARFEALRARLELDPAGARIELDALLSAQKGARLFDPFVWRLALADAWRAGAFDRYAALAEAALANVGPSASPAIVLGAYSSAALARALLGDPAACRAALDRCALDSSTDEDRRDAHATIAVARALLQAREGRIEQAKDTVIPALSSLSTTAPEVRELALAILGARAVESVAAEGYRGASDELVSERDRALARAFPSVKFAIIEEADASGRAPPSLEIDPTVARVALPAPVRSRVDPIAWARAPAVLGLLALLVGKLVASGIELVAVAMGALVLLAIVVDRGRAARDRAHTERALAELQSSLADGSAPIDRARRALEDIAASSTALLASEACLLRSRVASAEGDLVGALAWAEQCLARLHGETLLQGSVARLRADAAERAMLSLAALGQRAQAEGYALLFETPRVVRAQLAAVRLLSAARSPGDGDATEEALGYARLAARHSNVPEVQLLAHVMLSINNLAREEACREALRRWPQGRAWIEAAAPTWVAKLIAPMRVTLDPAGESEAVEPGAREDELAASGR